MEEWPREEEPVMERPVEERYGMSYLMGSNAMHKEEATSKPG